MNNINLLGIRVSKIVQKQRFVKDIFNSIYKSSGRVLLVGGAVRDILLTKEVTDLDFEVYGLSLDALQSILQMYGKVDLVGKSFGVLRLFGLDVDWSLPRQDSSGRHPSVQYDPHMKYQDAFARRDLTINAMGIDMQSYELIDPFGGLQDLKDGILRSPHLDFFIQDPLRLLRVMQFAGRFEMKVDHALSEKCRTIDMSIVSKNRVEQEFFKLFLQASRPSIGLRWLYDIKKWDDFFPQIVVTENLFTIIDDLATQKYQSDQQKKIVLCASIYKFLIPSEKNNSRIHSNVRHDYQSVISRIITSISLKKAIIKIVHYLPEFQDSLSIVQAKWLAYWLAPEITMDTMMFLIKPLYSQEIFSRIVDIIQQAGVVNGPEKPLLSGKDFLDVAKGVELGKLVKLSYELQLNQGIIDKDQLKSKVINI